MRALYFGQLRRRGGKMTHWEIAVSGCFNFHPSSTNSSSYEILILYRSRLNFWKTLNYLWWFTMSGFRGRILRENLPLCTNWVGEHSSERLYMTARQRRRLSKWRGVGCIWCCCEMMKNLPQWASGKLQNCFWWCRKSSFFLRAPQCRRLCY